MHACHSVSTVFVMMCCMPCVCVRAYIYAYSSTKHFNSKVWSNNMYLNMNKNIQSGNTDNMCQCSHSPKSLTCLCQGLLCSCPFSFIQLLLDKPRNMETAKIQYLQPVVGLADHSSL